MYLQITTRCNMTCSHCCFSCTKDGEDMSLETFRTALGFNHDITLGGGEPTLHKHFDTILLESLAGTIQTGNLLDVITNGSITKSALILASLTKSKLLRAQLSLDVFHDEIDSVVVEAFEDTPLVNHQPVGVRNTTREIAPRPRGRALSLVSSIKRSRPSGLDCMCTDPFVKPNGDIVQCGCKGSPKIGSVENGPVEHKQGCYHPLFS